VGAFLIVFLITRLTRRFSGKDQRGSVIAFLVGFIVCTTLASFGYSNENLSPLQAVPWAAITYGKFALALLFVDDYNARQIIADTTFQTVLGRKGFRLSVAWAIAAVTIAAGASASYLLPGVAPLFGDTATSGEAGPAGEVSAPTPGTDGAWVELASSDIHGRVMMPGASRREVSSIASPKGGEPIGVVSYEAERLQEFFAVQCLHFPVSAIDPSATVERVIESSRDGMLKSTGANLISERWLQGQEWPTLDIVAAKHSGTEDATIKVRFILQGRRICSLLVVNGSTDDTKHFFDSFKFDPAEDEYRIPHRRQSPPRQADDHPRLRT